MGRIGAHNASTGNATIESNSKNWREKKREYVTDSLYRMCVKPVECVYRTHMANMEHYSERQIFKALWCFRMRHIGYWKQAAANYRVKPGEEKLWAGQSIVRVRLFANSWSENLLRLTDAVMTNTRKKKKKCSLWWCAIQWICARPMSVIGSKSQVWPFVGFSEPN